MKGPYVVFTDEELKRIYTLFDYWRKNAVVTKPTGELDDSILEKISHAFSSDPKFREPHQ